MSDDGDRVTVGALALVAAALAALLLPGCATSAYVGKLLDEAAGVGRKTPEEQAIEEAQAVGRRASAAACEADGRVQPHVAVAEGGVIVVERCGSVGATSLAPQFLGIAIREGLKAAMLGERARCLASGRPASYCDAVQVRVGVSAP